MRLSAKASRIFCRSAINRRARTGSLAIGLGGNLAGGASVAARWIGSGTNMVWPQDLQLAFLPA